MRARKPGVLRTTNYFCIYFYKDRKRWFINHSGGWTLSIGSILTLNTRRDAERRIEHLKSLHLLRGGAVEDFPKMKVGVYQVTITRL